MYFTFCIMTKLDPLHNSTKFHQNASSRSIAVVAQAKVLFKLLLLLTAQL